MDNESEVAYVRAVMDNLPTLARRPAFSGRRQAPKGEGLRANTVQLRIAAASRNGLEG
jgi:hypothetical protein